MFPSLLIGFHTASIALLFYNYNTLPVLFRSSQYCTNIKYLLIIVPRCLSYRSNEEEVDGDSMLYLTPVRRTSRRSRSICPHLEPRGDPCFVSPSELVEKEGRDNVRVLPNEALKVLQGTEPLVGANCFQ